MGQFLFRIVFRNIPRNGCFIGSSVRLHKGGMLGDAWGLGRVVSPGLRPSVTFRRQLTSGVVVFAF